MDDGTDDRREHQMDGSIKFDTYKKLLRAVHSYPLICAVFMLFLLKQFASSGADYLISIW